MSKREEFWCLLSVAGFCTCVVCVLFSFAQPWAMPMLTYAFPVWVLVSIRSRMEEPASK